MFNKWWQTKFLWGPPISSVFLGSYKSPTGQRSGFPAGVPRSASFQPIPCSSLQGPNMSGWPLTWGQGRGPSTAPCEVSVLSASCFIHSFIFCPSTTFNFQMKMPEPEPVSCLWIQCCSQHMVPSAISLKDGPEVCFAWHRVTWWS